MHENKTSPHPKNLPLIHPSGKVFFFLAFIPHKKKNPV